MRYEYTLFDLDGTLTDSGLGVTNSVMHALRKCGIEVHDRSALFKFIGPPLTDSFKNYYGFSNEETRTAIAYFDEYYDDTGIFENSVYAGIHNLLGELKDNGAKLIVATSKPEESVIRVLEHFKIADYFTFIAGSKRDGTRKTKGDVIRHVLDNCCPDSSNVIMIGDREYDILGAKEAGIASMGVLFGYGDRRELELAGADYIAHTAADIGRILLTV